MTEPHDDARRRLMQGAGAMLLSQAPGAATAGAAPAAPVQPGPAMTGARPSPRTPGKAGDFDFLNGRWRILNHRVGAQGQWEAFEGEARCFGILGGLCSVEELLIPARRFSGMGLRLLDVKEKLWQDHWVNAAHGVVGTPGLPGSFEAGAGIFENEEVEDGQKVIYRSVWDRITPQSCRWQQGSSRDGGRTWALNWSMDWRRMA